MKKSTLQKKEIEKLLKLYEQYKKFKGISESVVKIKKPPLTGEGIFARLLSAEGGMGRESVSAIPLLRGR